MRLRRIGCQRPMYTIRKLERPQRRMLSPIARSGHIHEIRYNCYIHKQNSECSNQESCIPHGDGNQCWRWKNLFYCPLTIRLVYLHQVCGPEWAAKTLPASVTSMILCVCHYGRPPHANPKHTHSHARMQSAMMIGRVIGEPFLPIHSLNWPGKWRF